MVNEREEIMEREESLTTDGISEAHMIAIQNVAAFGGVSGSVLYYTGIEPLAPREGDIWI